jgi:uncharacterized membrane protein
MVVVAVVWRGNMEREDSDMPNQTTVDLIAKQEWLEPVENRLQKAVKGVFNAAGDTGRTIQDALHGVWLGDPLHAALTDVPIGSWTAAIVMDAAESITGNNALAKGADAAVGIGLVGAVASAITGLTDWQHVGGAPRRVGLVHGLLNLSGAALFATSFFLRRGNSRTSAKVASLGGYAVMLAAARLGGGLVYPILSEQTMLRPTAGLKNSRPSCRTRIFPTIILAAQISMEFQSSLSRAEGMCLRWAKSVLIWVGPCPKGSARAASLSVRGTVRSSASVMGMSCMGRRFIRSCFSTHEFATGRSRYEGTSKRQRKGMRDAKRQLSSTHGNAVTQRVYKTVPRSRRRLNRAQRRRAVLLLLQQVHW